LSQFSTTYETLWKAQIAVNLLFPTMNCLTAFQLRNSYNYYSGESMAVTQTEARLRAQQSPLRNTRRNEIIAIALFALGLLFALCLLSYDANDASWNVGGQTAAGHNNFVGAIGANVAVALYQAFGLAACLLPLLLLAAAWRRFRTRRIYAPLSRVVGLVLLVLACAALLSLSNVRPLFDGSFAPGGLIGTLIARALAGGLNTIGAGVLLFTLAATGLLLATNFSFVRFYEQLAAAFNNHFGFLHALPARFNEWRARRHEQAAQRVEERRLARAAREALQRNQTASVAATTPLRDMTAAERVAEFMRETSPEAEAKKSVSTAIKRSALASATNSSSQVQTSIGDALKVGAALDSSLAATENSSALVSNQESFSGTAASRAAMMKEPISASAEAKEAAAIEAMVEAAAVVRLEPGEVESEKDLSGARRTSTVEKTRRALITPPAAPIADYTLPSADFLNAPPPHSEQADEELRDLAARVAEKCREFNVTGKIEYICPGPVVTTYEFKPDPGIKYARVTNLVDDLCLALKADSIRIDRVPGKAHVGIEVPNPRRDTIHLREVIESRQFRESTSKLTIALGKTIDGLNYVADLARMPHLLIAGATGAGKSVGVNSLIVSILYKAQPDEVKFIMVDPKRLELGLYADIPHLATPIITDPKRASYALKWAVSEMERRYKELAMWGVRNIDGFNTEVMRRNLVKDYDDTGAPHKPLPYLVIIIDELADLMMTSGHEVEESITRLAQMARAVGIHLVLATQRPSVDVITGLIKANFPSRISFRVSSKVDSRTIIDANGAEQLLGRGDMLFLPPGTSRLVRVHGAFVDETEINKIVTHVKAQGDPVYDETITQSEEEASGADGANGERDELYEDALRICVEMKRASTSVLQRRLRIGYGRAAAILDMMEREGMIGQADGARPRPVLGRAHEFLNEQEMQHESEVI
jgi:S-DNA-T family DNA segregation ATPase FtsK/SpoIIIE